MIADEQVAQIRHLFHAEHWKIGTIAAQLNLHPDTVRAALNTDRFRRQPRQVPSARRRPSHQRRHRSWDSTDQQRERRAPLERRVEHHVTDERNRRDSREFDRQLDGLQ